MNLSFYTAAVGAGQQQNRMNVQGNNIANVNTYGFKAEKTAFSSLMYQSMNGIDDAQLPVGVGSKIDHTVTDFSGGSLMVTDRAQDYTILGDGFFALQDPGTGEISFTRDGSFTLSQYQRVTEDGTMADVYYLSDGNGRFVLNKTGDRIEVTDSSAAQPVGVFDFVNTTGMLHVGDNRFVPTENNGTVRVGTGTVQQGALEASNTDLAYELTRVIEAQRSYSYALKMVQTSDEIETTVNNLRG